MPWVYYNQRYGHLRICKNILPIRYAFLVLKYLANPIILSIFIAILKIYRKITHNLFIIKLYFYVSPFFTLSFLDVFQILYDSKLTKIVKLITLTILFQYTHFIYISNINQSHHYTKLVLV